MRTSAGVTWLQGDHLASGSLATNAAGQKVSDERYYAYGGTRSGSMPTDYQFTGQKRDTGTGLPVAPQRPYYYGARYYDPVAGRFISADTIVAQAGKPQALNRYSYVYNNPQRYVDPSGNFTEDELVERGAYTAKDLRWMAENQSSWYTYLMGAQLGDPFGFFNPAGALGYGAFSLQNGSLTITGFGATWEGSSGARGNGGFGSVRDWGRAVGQSGVRRLGAGDPLLEGLPNPHIELSREQSLSNAWFVWGWDVGCASLTSGGYAIIGLDTLAAPPDLAGKAFGAFIVNYSSIMSTLTLLDTIATSGPNSVAFGVNLATYVVGWSSAWLPLGFPFDVAAAWVQVNYDSNSLLRLERQGGR